MKSVEDIIKLRYQKISLTWSHTFLFENLSSEDKKHYEIFFSIGNDERLILICNNENYITGLTEKKIIISHNLNVFALNYTEIDSVSVAIKNDFQQHRKSKEKWCSIQIITKNSNIYIIETEKEGVVFFITDMLKIAVDKSE